MPYIQGKETRKILEKRINKLLSPLKDILYTEEIYGVLNHIITKLLLGTCPQRYKDFNSLIGVLECCKLEFYRRAVAVYEDKKIEENGDVY